MRLKLILSIAYTVFSLLVFTTAVYAADYKPPTFTPSVPLPGDGPMSKSYPFPENGTVAPIGELIKQIMKYIIGICGVLGTIMLIYGGFLYTISRGEGKLIADAQNTILSAIIGIVLAATSYLILATVNTDLVNFKATSITSVKPMGCCVGEKTCSSKSSDQCTSGTKFLKNGICYDNVCQIVDTTKINGCEKVTDKSKCQADSNCVWLGTDCVASSAVKGNCSYYNANSTCSLIIGCVWNTSSNTCEKNTSELSTLKCGISQAEYNASASGVTCCKGTGDTYKYARLTINKNCADACGSGWMNWGNSAPNCRSYFGWGP